MNKIKKLVFVVNLGDKEPENKKIECLNKEIGDENANHNKRERL